MSTSQADFVHWPTTLKLRGRIDRNCQDFLPGSFWEVLKPWLVLEQVLQRGNFTMRQWVWKFSWDFFFFTFFFLTYSTLHFCLSLPSFVSFLLVCHQPLPLPNNFFRSIAQTSPPSQVFSYVLTSRGISYCQTSLKNGFFSSLSTFKLCFHTWNICFSSALLHPYLFKMMPKTSLLW